MNGRVFALPERPRKDRFSRARWIYAVAAVTAMALLLVSQASARLPKQYSHYQFIGQGQLSDPRAMDISGNRVYVADGNTIKVFDLDGNKLAQYDADTPAWQRDNFEPQGIIEVAAGSDGSIYFTEYAATLHKYSPSIDTLTHYEGDDWFDLFAGVSELAAYKESLYASNSQTEKINKLSTAMSPVLSWGREGTQSAGEFWQPAALNTDLKGNVYLLSGDQQRRHRVQKFTPEGRYIKSWNATRWPGSLNSARGLGVDPKKNTAKNSIYVSDSETNRVYKFNASNRLITTIGGSGSGRGRLSEPEDVEVTRPKACVYVLELGNKRVQVFSRTHIRTCS